jgi:hypothetical protein
VLTNVLTGIRCNLFGSKQIPFCASNRLRASARERDPQRRGGEAVGLGWIVVGPRLRSGFPSQITEGQEVRSPLAPLRRPAAARPLASHYASRHAASSRPANGLICESFGFVVAVVCRQMFSNAQSSRNARACLSGMPPCRRNILSGGQRSGCIERDRDPFLV